jgi:drug/metabolite transporter (DMT)-like permease
MFILYHMLLECVIVAIVFGLTPILNKYILKYISVESMIVFMGSAYLLFIAIYNISMKTQLSRDVDTLYKHPHLYPLILLSSFLIFGVANYYYLTVIKDNKTAIVASIIASYPMLTALAGYILYNEVLSIKQLVGIMIIVSGVVVVQSE